MQGLFYEPPSDMNAFALEANQHLAALGDCIEECMAYLVQLENVEWELSTRQCELQNVQGYLGNEEAKLKSGEVGAEDAVMKINGLQEHLTTLNAQVQSWYKCLEEYRANAVRHILESQSRGVSASEVLVEGWLLNWRRRQKAALIGAPNTNLAAELDEMEPFFDRVLKELLRLRQAIDGLGSHMNRTEHLAQNGLIAPLSIDLNGSLAQLNRQMIQFLDDSVVVAIQPPPILMITKTPASDNSRRGARPACQPVLRLLGGSQIGVRLQQRIQVSCHLVCDFEAENMMKNQLCQEQMLSERSKDKHQGPKLINSQSTMQEQNGRFFAQFSNMHVLRREKAGTDSSAEKVPKRRYYALFHLNVSVLGMQSSIIKLSLPILLVTHPKQIRAQGGDAYIFWELAFSPGRIIGNDDGGRFTFRKWFYACMDIIIDRELLDYWNQGLIAGFMSSAQSAQIVSSSDEPCLIVKFSDSRRDIIISFGSRDMEVNHVLPRPEELPKTTKKIDYLPLAEVVRSTSELRSVIWIYGLGGVLTPKAALLNHPVPQAKTKTSTDNHGNDPYKFIRPMWRIDAPGDAAMDDKLYNWVNSVGRESHASYGASSCTQESMDHEDFS